MKTKLLPKSQRKVQAIEHCDLIVHNDDVNTFDFVIETLVEICEQEYLQAVQCAHLIHNTGKCGVKRGSFEELKPKCEVLLKKGLSATIE
ncbi:MAG: ATP-dependent Clp protease adaptor ClpS [Bacteroidetes bacterium]|nr:MAG: ATP-dependent Clp protease adaptor ClpS [Bacteroidota bacterium]